MWELVSVLHPLNLGMYFQTDAQPVFVKAALDICLVTMMITYTVG